MVPVRKKAAHVIWTHCLLHRQGLIYRKLGEEIQAVFQAVYIVKNSPLRRKPFAKLCNYMEAAHTALLCYCEACRLCRAKLESRLLKLKGEVSGFLNDSNKNDDSNLNYIDDGIQNLVSLLDIFEN
jgi:hypothetical protein